MYENQLPSRWKHYWNPGMMLSKFRTDEEKSYNIKIFTFCAKVKSLIIILLLFQSVYIFFIFLMNLVWFSLLGR